MRAIEPDDLPFRLALFSRPELSTHKPDPRPDTEGQITDSHTADIAHWAEHGFGRWCVRLGEIPIGFCGLTRRSGADGLNISYHLAPEHWGRGHASALVAGMVALIDRAPQPPNGPVVGLVRPANPASARVLAKAGFTPSGEVTHGGAPTTRWIRRLPEL
jgi:RimJ/RimL family protein N-acetyltransferase